MDHKAKQQRLEQEYEQRQTALRQEQARLVKRLEADRQFIQDFQRYVQSQAEQGVAPHRIEYRCEEKPSVAALHCVSSSGLDFVASTTKQPQRSLPTYTVRARGSWIKKF